MAILCFWKDPVHSRIIRIAVIANICVQIISKKIILPTNVNAIAMNVVIYGLGRKIREESTKIVNDPKQNVSSH